LLLSLPGVVGWSGFGVPFYLGWVGLSGVIPASFPVGVGVVVPASFLVGAGRILPASFLVVAGGTVPASCSVGVLVPSSDPFLARSIKSPPTLFSSFSFSFPSIDGVGGGSILLLSGGGGRTSIPWSVGSILWSAGGTDGVMVRSRLALLRSSIPG